MLDGLGAAEQVKSAADFPKEREGAICMENATAEGVCRV